MKPPSRFRKKDKALAVSKPPVPPWKERTVVALCLLGLMGLLALLATVGGIAAQNKALDGQISRWRTLYHLTAEQAARVRQLELEFHGNGNPFTSRESGTPEENDAHHLAISRVMNPSDAERFLLDVQRNKRNH